MSVKYVHGATVKSGKTSSGENFGPGEIFAYDESSQILTLRKLGELSNSYDLEFVNVKGASEVVIDDSTKSDAKPCPNVDEPRRERRFENACRAARAMADNVGENVSALAQDVFDALARTLPCRWNGDVIVVMDEVEVRGPKYDEASGSGATHGAAERVQKVLALERAKLGV